MSRLFNWQINGACPFLLQTHNSHDHQPELDFGKRQKYYNTPETFYVSTPPSNINWDDGDVTRISHSVADPGGGDQGGHGPPRPR